MFLLKNQYCAFYEDGDTSSPDFHTVWMWTGNVHLLFSSYVKKGQKSVNYLSIFATCVCFSGCSFYSSHLTVNYYSLFFFFFYVVMCILIFYVLFYVWLIYLFFSVIVVVTMHSGFIILNCKIISLAFFRLLFVCLGTECLVF